jgi:hypothetical protein
LTFSDCETSRAAFEPLSEPVRAGTYNRTNYHSERMQALEKWAAHIMALVIQAEGHREGR